MSQVSVVGGGPAGLSAALFLEKNDVDTVLFDADASWMHKAHLFNYPGVGSLDGSNYLEVARRQVDSFGCDRRQDVEVEDVESTGEGFVTTTAEDEVSSDYLVLATGADRSLAESLGCGFDGEVVDVDVTMETSVEDAYATGAMVREEEWQAVISAGDGAAAALNVLSKEKGENFHDFDTPGDADEVFGDLVE